MYICTTFFTRIKSSCYTFIAFPYFCISMTHRKIFWLLTLTVLLALFAPFLVQQGMFLDGITYGAISKNMANGLGTYFDPHYTQTLYPHFHEHPPLVFIIQSLFFNLFGNNFITEGIFCLFNIILTAIGISLCWRLLNDKNELKNYDWFPVLLWLTLPLVMWAYRSNLLENSLGVFTIFSVFFILKSLIQKRLVFLFLGSITVVGAFLSKGMVGLFPIAVPIIYAVVYKIDKSTIRYTVYLPLFTALVAFMLSIAFPELKNNILIYFDQQLIPALTNKREVTTDNRFSIMFNLILELSLPLLLVIYFSVKQWLSKRNLEFLKDKNALVFMLIALSASLPLIISLKQRKLYLIPSLPFFILSIACVITPFIKLILDKWSQSTLKWIKRGSLTGAFILILVSVFLFGNFSRDNEKQGDIYIISNAIPHGTILSTTIALSEDWSLNAYMSRVGELSLDRNHAHEYFLIEKNKPIDSTVSKKYQTVDLKLEKYELLKRMD